MSTILNQTVDNINWSSIPEGLIYLRTLRSFRRPNPVREYVDPFVLEQYERILPPRLLYDVRDYWRPKYDEEIFIKNLRQFESKRLPAPEDWESFQNGLDAELHYTFQSLGFNQFDSLVTNWSANAGFGYDGKKGDPGVQKRAYITACVLALEYRKGTRLTLDEYTPDLALVKPEPSPSSKSKLRPVWGVAYHNWILSALSGQPAMQAVPPLLEGYPLVHNINPTVDIPKLYTILENKYPDYHWYQLDWSHFDSDVQLFESNTYDDRMHHRVQFNGDELAYCSYRYSEDWRSHGTVVDPQGNKYVRNGNVGSGDSLTYHKDTEVDYRRIKYLIRNFEADHCPNKAVVLAGGDDPIVGVPNNVQLPINEIAHTAKVEFNATLNAKKFRYAIKPSDLRLFKTEANPGMFAQRKEDPVDVLGRAMLPLGTVPSGNLSTARIRMICESTGWSNNYLNRTYLQLRQLHGEADRSLLPLSWHNTLTQARVQNKLAPSKLSKILCQ
jgi:hypothetical protein